MARLDEIEARLNAATQGEWQTHQEGSVRICEPNDSERGCFAVAEAEILGRARDDAVSVAAFIAAAPADVRFLLARVRALEIEISSSSI